MFSQECARLFPILKNLKPWVFLYLMHLDKKTPMVQM